MTITGWFRTYRAVIFLFILAAFILRIPILRVRAFDPDEFQHLHSARQIYRGQIPYRDYFEHHTPFLHFILAGFYPIFGEEIGILFAARVLMMVFIAAILYLTYVLTKTLYNTDAGLFAALFLSYVIMFLEKSIEVRPDLPAATFWLASLIFMVRGIQRNREESIEPRAKGKEQEGEKKCPIASVASWPPALWYIFSGLAIGIAMMFTQKILFALAGLLTALIWMLLDPRAGISRKRSLKSAAIFLGSTMVPIVLTSLFFYANNGLRQFINCNFIMNFRWKMKFWPFDYIKQMLRQNPFFPVASIVGLFMATSAWILAKSKERRAKSREQRAESRGRRAKSRGLRAGNPKLYALSSVPYALGSMLYAKHQASGSFAPILCTYALIAGLFVVPVPYRQYYLLFLPLLAMYCGVVFMRMAEFDLRGLISDLRNCRPRPLSVGFTILALNLVIAGLIYTLRLSRPAVLNSRMLYLILWISLSVFAVSAFAFKRSAYAALIISIGIIAYPLSQTVDQLSPTNNNQLANVRHVMDITSEEDTVLDGWSGFGFLRSHAYYYYFLHPEMRAMLSEKERSDDLIRNLEEKRTKVVIYDGHVKNMHKKVQKYITANYVPSGRGNIYVRKSE